ncbi:MAG TPA: helix-turn-helix transcriptional regulator [Verrucomicrobiae bacterium]|nr:helix-turn-helix transcriptional regulator [Verrucomicrobiae bacterium]
MKATKLNSSGSLAILEKLSPRQAQVLMMLADGYKNKVIADKLGLSVNTVCGHIKQIFA